MPSLLTNITAAVYREYDRRIRRASLVTEYGDGHHGHAGHAQHDETDPDVAIANLPRGAAVELEQRTQGEAKEPLAADLPPLEPLAPAAPPPAAAPSADADDGEAEIVNTRPGA